MPIQKPTFDGETPQEPHLAVMVSEVEALPIIPGMKLFLVFDPHRVDRVVPVYLAKFNRQNMVFRCNCGNPKCTRVLKYQLKVEGHHPASTGPAVATAAE